MPRNRDPQRKALRSTEADLDAAAEITPEDLDLAAAAWRRDAPSEARSAFDAEPVEEEREER